jgi:cytidylate kinase
MCACEPPRVDAVILAVDGPAGSGKSTVCRGVAERAGMRYLDTGAMYRAVTLAVLDAGVDPADHAAVLAVARSSGISSETDPRNPVIALHGRDVSTEIRSQQVTDSVSAVSAVPEVRELLVERQRAEVQSAVDAGLGIVVEGRDIGTVVLPDADLKIFLTADQAERARRRAAEQAGEIEDTQASLAARDSYDSRRAVSPLTQADDAVVLDTTAMTLDEVIEAVLTHMGEAE